MVKLCPIDGAPVEAERVDVFYVCSRCREMLTDTEVVKRATRRTRKRYLAIYYPNGYDGPTRTLDNQIKTR